MEKLKNALLHGSTNPEQSSLEDFRHWMVAFVVCNFNVDIGPEIELVYPPSTEFTTADLSAICFNSFPERQDTETVNDIDFHFTIANNSPDIKLSSPHRPHGSPDLFFGSCVFRQEFDQESKRSFNQKSLVIISTHDFPAFFSSILKYITSAGLISDPSTLEAAFTEISTWRAPAVGSHELPFMGSVMVLEMSVLSHIISTNLLTFDSPPHHAFPLQGLPGALPPRASATHLPTIFAYEPAGPWSSLIPLMPSLKDLYVVFESMLLCEPVIVVSKSPQLCSSFVLAIVDLIKPVPYAGSIRPYSTMQSDFQSVGLDGGHPRPFVIGITNPFLLRRMVDSAEALGRGKPAVVYLDHTKSQVPIKRSHSHHHRQQPAYDMPGDAELYPSKKTCLKADRTFIHALEALLLRASETSEDEITPFVRRHFAELAAQFLSPVNRYLATSVSPAITSPGGSFQYANFSQSSFLHSLSKHGTAVKTRGQGPIQRHKSRDSLYGRFCESLNWHSWLQMKVSLEREASAGLLRSSVGHPAT